MTGGWCQQLLRDAMIAASARKSVSARITNHRSIGGRRGV
jgi:hypothetical protein